MSVEKRTREREGEKEITRDSHGAATQHIRGARATACASTGARRVDLKSPSNLNTQYTPPSAICTHRLNLLNASHVTGCLQRHAWSGARGRTTRGPVWKSARRRVVQTNSERKYIYRSARRSVPRAVFPAPRTRLRGIRSLGGKREKEREKGLFIDHI